MLGPVPLLMKKEFTAVLQRLRNAALDDLDWGSHNTLDDLVLDLYLRGPEDDLTSVEARSPIFMYIYTINKLLCQTDTILIFVLFNTSGWVT